MRDLRRHASGRSSFVLELCGWTFVLGLGIWELTLRTGGFGAWLQSGVAVMGVVKAVWSLRAGDR